METQLASHLLKLAAIYAKAKSIEESTIGRQCAADGRFFARIRQGKTFTVKKYDEVMQWFLVNWPDQVNRPEFFSACNNGTHCGESDQCAPLHNQPEGS